MSRESSGALDCGGEKEKVSDSQRDLTQENVSPNLLRTLAEIYPDIEPEYLHQTWLRFHSRLAEVQTFLEEALPSLPVRSAGRAARLAELEAACEPHCERLWQCPGCSSWQIIQLRPDQDIIEDTEEVAVFKRLTGGDTMIIYHRDIEIFSFINYITYHEFFLSCC